MVGRSVRITPISASFGKLRVPVACSHSNRKKFLIKNILPGQVADEKRGSVILNMANLPIFYSGLQWFYAPWCTGELLWTMPLAHKHLCPAVITEGYCFLPLYICQTYLIFNGSQIGTWEKVIMLIVLTNSSLCMTGKLFWWVGINIQI